MIYHILYQIGKNLKDIDFTLLKLLNDLKEGILTTWRNGYAEDCKFTQELTTS